MLPNLALAYKDICCSPCEITYGLRCTIKKKKIISICVSTNQLTMCFCTLVFRFLLHSSTSIRGRLLTNVINYSTHIF